MAQESTRELVMRQGLQYGPLVAALNAGSVIFWWFVSVGAVTLPHFGLSGGYPSETELVSRAIMSALINAAVLLGALVATFLAGMFTASGAGSVGAGSLAGVVAGAFGGVMGGVTRLVVVFALTTPQSQAPSSTIGLAAIESHIIEVGWVIIGLALDCAIGGGMGALGGLVGLSRYRKAHPERFSWPVYPAGLAQPGFHPYPYPFAPYPLQYGYPSLPEQRTSQQPTELQS